MNKLRYYIKSARLRTLPLSISGILIGVFVALDNWFINIGVSILAVSTAISLQILSNYANELGDIQKGTDNDQRLGPKRSIQSGLLTQSDIKKMVIFFAIISILLGIGLIWVAFHTFFSIPALIFMALGLGAVISSMKYTLGKKAYGYAGLGDLFVFVFFGLASVLGVYYLITQTFYPLAILPATSIGLLSVALLNTNNMRDVDNDKEFSKNTVVVRIGLKKAKIYHTLLIFMSFLFAIGYNIFSQRGTVCYLFLLTTPLFGIHLHNIFTHNGKELDKEMRVISMSTLLFTLLFCIGILLQ